MTRRILPAAVLLGLVAVVALGGCGGDPGRPSAATPSTDAPATPGVAESPGAPNLTVSPPPRDGTAPPAAVPAAPVPPAGVPTAAAAPPARPGDGSTRWRSTSPPPVELPPRQAGEPSAREVVAAFRAAGLKVTNPRDRSVECGPDGLGLGCSELIVTDGVAVYVFPDESSAGDLAEVWSTGAHRSGTVVLNYLEAPTPRADRPRYEKILTTLR
ncbi:hypothetical protein ACQPYA_08315 [Micromonospora sp. CA-263727]|uniref:hypothetical protein n=1 Tax=Micromonospora sp. CA-263727 TaxID=3239967 RepID=UPI003D8AF513